MAQLEYNVKQVSFVYEVWRNEGIGKLSKLLPLLSNTVTNLQYYFENFNDTESISKFGEDITEASKSTDLPNYVSRVLIAFYCFLPSVAHIRITFHADDSTDFSTYNIQDLWDWCSIRLKDTSDEINFEEIDNYKISPGYHISLDTYDGINAEMVANALYLPSESIFEEAGDLFTYSHFSASLDNIGPFYKFKGYVFDEHYDESIDIFPFSTYGFITIIYSVRMLNFKLRNSISSVRSSNTREERVKHLSEFIKYNDRFRTIVRETKESENALFVEYGDLVLHNYYHGPKKHKDAYSYLFSLLNHEISIVENHSADVHQYMLEINSLDDAKLGVKLQNFSNRLSAIAFIIALASIVLGIISASADYEAGAKQIQQWLGIP